MSSAFVAVEEEFEELIRKLIVSGKNMNNRLKHARTRQMNDIIAAQASTNDQA